MSDIFISYASEDRPCVRMLADALLAQGWSVWWDQRIPAGKTFDHVIVEALASARCVVVLWSRQSINSNWVREEAEEGRKRGILIPVLIDNVLPPFGFGRIQAADLLHWDGTKTSEAFQKLAMDIATILGPPPITTETQGTSTSEGLPRQAVEEENHQPRTAPKAILLSPFLYKRKLRWSLPVALFTVIMVLILNLLGVFEPKPKSVKKELVQAETQPRPTRAPASESALKLIAILAEGSEPLTSDLYYVAGSKGQVLYYRIASETSLASLVGGHCLSKGLLRWVEVESSPQKWPLQWTA